VRRAILFALCLCLGASAQQLPAPSAPAESSYEVSGIVVNAVSGEPVAGATLTLGPAASALFRPMQRRNAADQLRTTHSAADGSFSFVLVRPGKYSLAAARHGFQQQAYEQHDQFSSAIVVGPGKPSTELRFRLDPDSSLSGTIVDEHNEAITNAMVTLFRRGIQNGKRGIYRVQQTSSNDQGYYHVAHLRPGEYYVVVAATPWYAQAGNFGYARVRGATGGLEAYAGGGPPGPANPALDMAYPLTFYPGVNDSASAEPIEVKPGERQTADFNLAAVPSLHVRVHAASNSAQPGIVAMVLREAFGSPIFTGARNVGFGQGVTEISGIAPGRYILQLGQISQNSGGNFNQRATLQREVDLTGDIDLNAADFSASVNVSGTLQFQGSAPNEPARLELRRQGAPPMFLQVSDKGEISSDRRLPSGKYEILLPLSGFQITHLAVTGAKLDGQSIQIGSDDVRLTIQAAKASARIGGTALKDGKPFAGAMIVLVPQDMSRPTLYRRDQSDSDGSFQLLTIPPGMYTLVAIENGWDFEWSNPQVMRPFLRAGKVVQVSIEGNYQADVPVQNAAPAAR
jgi:hypothetical protein